MSKSIMQDIAINLASKDGNTVDTYPRRTFVAGEKIWYAGANLQKDGIVLLLYSDPYNDVRYYTLLKFPFDKRSVPSPDEALTKITEVLTSQPADSATPPPEQAPGDADKNSLQNQDIIKMVKAGLDDSIILAKIKSSSCQFDTTTDTLIALKQNGVSAAVLRAMTEAANKK
jgi:hypothetical protein